MEAEVWHIDEYRRALEDDRACTPAEMAGHFDKVLARMRVDVMAHGNVAREEAVGLVDTIAAALGRPEPLPEAELPTRHALSLPAAQGARGEGEESSGGNGVVLVDLEAETEEEKNSAVQVGPWCRLVGRVVVGLRGVVGLTGVWRVWSVGWVVRLDDEIFGSKTEGGLGRGVSACVSDTL